MSHAVSSETNILDNLEAFLESANNIAISTEGFDLDAELSSLDAELSAPVEDEVEESEPLDASVNDDLAALMDEISASVSPAKKEVKIEPVAEVDDELAALLGELEEITEVKAEEVVEAKSATDDLDNLAAEMALATEELISELDELEAMESAEAKESEQAKQSAETKQAKQSAQAKKKTKAPKVEGELSDQLKATYGNDSSTFALTESGEFGQAELDKFFSDIDALAVKAKQKAANLVAFWQAGAELSVYTEIGIQLLTDKGEMTTADLREAYMVATPKAYTYGTASSQTGQVFQLLPVFGMATRVGRDRLILNEDSSIAKLFIKLNK